MDPRPLTFVVMAFGDKPNPIGGPPIQFNHIYQDGLRPAIEAARLDPIRADEEPGGGFIDVDMYERLLLCDWVVADLTGLNANVYYELGIRHATRPHTTLVLHAEGHPVPFDIAHVRMLPYKLGADGRLKDPAAFRAQVTERLLQLQAGAAAGQAKDSPLFVLLNGYRGPELAHLATDTFRDRVEQTRARRDEIARARHDKDEAALRRVQDQLLDGPSESLRLAAVVDVYLSWRAIGRANEMVALYARMPKELRDRVMIREQLGFALNRLGRRGDAIDVLRAVIAEVGPNPETNGLLGRVYKDRRDDALGAGDPDAAAGHLENAIAIYLAGFEADHRDYYPGVNAVTLMESSTDPAHRKAQKALLPVVRYAVEMAVRKRTVPDYWDRATQLELAVLAADKTAATRLVGLARAAEHEDWQLTTTANNLRLIHDARVARGQDVAWIDATRIRLLGG